MYWTRIDLKLRDPHDKTKLHVGISVHFVEHELVLLASKVESCRTCTSFSTSSSSKGGATAVNANVAKCMLQLGEKRQILASGLWARAALALCEDVNTEATVSQLCPLSYLLASTRSVSDPAAVTGRCDVESSFNSAILR